MASWNGAASQGDFPFRDAAALWEALLGRLRGRRDLTGTDIETWLAPAKPLSLSWSGGAQRSAARLRVLAPNPTYRDWLAETYAPILRDEAVNLGVSDLEVEFAGEADASPAKPLPFEAPRRIESALNPYHTFDSFVDGEGNRFARAAALAVAENPGKAYNPLYIHSDVGLGKSHLLHAIGNFLAVKHPHLRVGFVISDRFVSDVVAAMRHGKQDDFHDKYRSLDVLLMDDVEYLHGKEKSQEQFLHIFNLLHGADRQIVLTGNCAPNDLHPLFDPRIRSRFEWGLTAPIKPPDVETRVAILFKKAEARRISLPEDVAHILAGRASRNIRELEGLLNYVSVRASMEGVPLSAAFVHAALAERFGEKSEIPATINEIQHRVAEYFKLSVKKLKSKNNTHAVSTPRHIAMYLSRELAGESFPEIGRQFGFDHASVVYAYKKVEGKMKRDEAFRKTVETLRGLFR